MITAIKRPAEHLVRQFVGKQVLVTTSILLAFFNMSLVALAQVPRSEPTVPGAVVLRIATFNAAMNRKSAGELSEGLLKGDSQASKIAEILRAVSPDVFLLNEIDYDERSAEVFLNRYLSSQDRNEKTEQTPWKYFFAGPVNTGVDSGLDLDGNGKLHEPNDAWGFGNFPGQYGMAVFSRYEIQTEAIRTFQNFRWSQMPGALRPMRSTPGSTERESYYPDAVWDQLRLSSKSHWDVPILIGSKTLHLIASHPTPPVFDGPEDRNGCRNHDEIRLLMDYVSGDSSGAYIVDDNRRTGALAPEAAFVIAGDLNSDPIDGDGRAEAIRKLLEHPRLAKSPAPKSLGGVEASEESKGANLKHQADPANDTGDFNDRNPGNLRIDFALPSANLKVLASGVYWPSKAQSPEANALVSASDHRLVWVDIQLQ
ncbi:MAG: endonuclease/exonuclease/phosphatase family protein [Planctomycetota bacterium]|nr:endonuclease/exonuclease/phosphatase family protein [Planctomycetota bacterium]